MQLPLFLLPVALELREVGQGGCGSGEAGRSCCWSRPWSPKAPYQPESLPSPAFPLAVLVTSPRVGIPQNNEKLQESPCIFALTPRQVELIRNSRELQPGIKAVQVVLRICYSDTSGPQEDQYPPNIAVKVNHSYCSVPGYYPSNKPGVEPKRPCRPINLTHLMYLSSATNRITVTWGNYGKSYSVALYLVRQLTSSELLQRLKTIGVKHPELCKALVKEKLRLDPDSEIATTGVRVSLICPLVKMRLSVPCRAETCAHLQCFDAVFYLQMNEKKPTWMCPVCDKPAPYDQLIIDGLLSKILSECEDADEIEYLVDGSWCPIRAEKERSCSPQCPILVLGTSDANGLLSAAAGWTLDFPGAHPRGWGAGGPRGAEGGVIFFFLLLFISFLHPFPWLLAPVPRDSPLGELKKSKMTKVQKKKKENETNKIKLLQTRRATHTAASPAGAEPREGAGRPREPRSDAPPPPSSRDHSSWCRGTGRVGAVGAAGGGDGRAHGPPPWQHPRL
ncbi:E3 SUMO-protein ligase PIAS4 isoform X3 [Callorhinus ursinus]|uniref:E3 SUMO-protein ligase PIAS4 isoform X3 n=1 Tax=Callorhinus ursinus TaxID=34884 RepID=UPI003CD02591